MMSMVKKSLQLELYNFIQSLSLKKINHVTNSAYNQARMKIKPEIFKHFIAELNREFYSDNDERIVLYKGFRMLACDGSFFNLPFVPSLVQKYGTTSNQFDAEVLNARCSILYDLENNMIIGGALASYKTGEREMLLTLLNENKKNGFKELVILDRGYPSFDLAYELKKRKMDFLMRIKSDFSGAVSDFVQGDKQDDIIELQPGKNTNFFEKFYTRKTAITVRLVKVLLESGEVEILMTSLLNAKEYDLSLFKELYFKRWGIETLYDKLKNKLKIEDFTGYSETSILQDFYCTLFLSNVQSLLVSEANDELKMQHITDKKYEYKVNTNLSIGFIKTRIIDLFLKESDEEDTLKELEGLFLKTLIPIRPNRSYERNPNKYRKRVKPKITKNYRTAL
jgi:Transposase DDE domain